VVSFNNDNSLDFIFISINLMQSNQDAKFE